MAIGSKKISDLSPDAVIATTDYLVIVSSGVTYKILWSSILRSGTGPVILWGSDTAANINAIASPIKGDLWIVTVAGTINSQAAVANDFALYNGSAWEVTGSKRIAGLASSVAHNLLSFADSSGLVIEDSGILKTNVLLSTAAAALFTGSTAPTLGNGDNSTKVATTAYADANGGAWAQTTAWAGWTNFTIGSGGSAASVLNMLTRGKITNFRLYAILGTAGQSVGGAVSIDLTGGHNLPAIQTYTKVGIIGQVTLTQSATVYTGKLFSDGTVKVDSSVNNTVYFNRPLVLSSAVPFTWAAGDSIEITGLYENA